MKNRQKDNHLHALKIEEYIGHIQALEVQIQSLDSQVQRLDTRRRFALKREKDSRQRIKALEHSERRLTIQLEEYICHIKALEAHRQWQQEDANEQIKKANERTVEAQKIARDFSLGRSMEHEPTRQSSTYIVPKRPPSQLDRFFSFFIPRFIFMVNLAVALALAFVLAIPSLCSVVRSLLEILIRGGFLIIVVSTVVFFIIAIFGHRKP
jgi:ABC-type multidrug transport system fused ATPase/permease subunit